MAGLWIHLGLEAAAVLTVMRAIRVACDGYVDAAGLSTGVQGVRIPGAAFWV